MVRMLRRLWDDGPMYFVYAVVAYFAFTALDIGERVPSFERLSEIAQPGTPPPTETTAVSTGALELKVTSLRARPEDRGLLVNVTLEVKNNGASSVNFRSEELVLRSASGEEQRPGTGPKAPMTVAPELRQLVPVTFFLTPDARGPYELQYAGNTVFTGYSV